MQISGQFRIGADMTGETRLIVRDVVEENERIVTGDVGAVVVPRVVVWVVTLLISLPGDACLFELRDQVVGRADMIYGRQFVVENAEVGAGFEPDIIRFARLQVVRRKVSDRKSVV